MFAQSFSQVTPPARYDGVPWTLVIVQEAPPVDGVFVTIATVTVPLDATPDTPNPVAITITTATLEYGRYRFAFQDAAGNQSPFSAPVLAPSVAGVSVSYLPSLADVGALVRARTKIAGGQEVGTFTTQTRPTDTQVTALIDLAAAEVATKVDQPIVEPYAADARNVVALRTSMHIEVSFFPEEAESRDSAYGRFAGQYATAVTELTQALKPHGLRLS